MSSKSNKKLLTILNGFSALFLLLGFIPMFILVVFFFDPDVDEKLTISQFFDKSVLMVLGMFFGYLMTFFTRYTGAVMALTCYVIFNVDFNFSHLGFRIINTMSGNFIYLGLPAFMVLIIAVLKDLFSN